MIDWSIFLNVVAAFSGSAFGAVDFCNSNLFAYDPLCMGLNERHIKIFNNQRLVSTVLLENVPQIIIQLTWGIVFSQHGFKSQVLLLAMCASFASIIVIAIDILAARKILQASANDVITEVLSIEITVKSEEIERLAKRFVIVHIRCIHVFRFLKVYK